MKTTFLLFFFLLFAGCTAPSALPPAVENFELSRYLGKWYEIARMPNYFEKNMTRVTADYLLDSSGKLRVINTGIKNGKSQSIRGVAKFADKPNRGELLVSFFPPFYSAYRIIWLDRSYSLACVMGKNRDLAWILARTPAIPPETLELLRRFLNSNGFDTSRLEYSYKVDSP